MNFKAIILTILIGAGLMACDAGQNPSANGAEASEQVQPVGPRVVPVSEFRNKMQEDGVQLIDVRTDEECADGMLPNAVQMNILDGDRFDEQIKSLDRSKPVLVYCKSGNRSGKAARYLSEHGFTQIYDLEGGYTGWIAENGEVIKTK